MSDNAVVEYFPDLHSMSGIEGWEDCWPDKSKQFAHPFDEHLLPLELHPGSNNQLFSMELLAIFPTLDANVPRDDDVRDFDWVDPCQMVNVETFLDQFIEEPVMINERQALAAGSSNLHLGTAVEDGGSKLPVPSIHERLLDMFRNSFYGFKQTSLNFSENELTGLCGCAIPHATRMPQLASHSPDHAHQWCYNLS